jgi:hypothetical protein
MPMSEIKVTVQPKPEGTKGHVTAWEYKPSGTINMSMWQAPFVQGDLGFVEGCLRGFSSSPLDGMVEFHLHEGLLTTKGNLTVYDQRAADHLEILIPKLIGMLYAIANQFPTRSLRFRATYKVKFET